MDLSRPSLSRRGFVIAGGLAVAARAAAGDPRLALAQALVPTPRQTEGPFYPVAIPLDADNDLVVVRGQPKPALGTVAHVFGRVLEPGGRPVAGARVEIWQCDVNGRYLHPRDRGATVRDEGFQGYGWTTTGADGSYRFRTIKPAPYTGRTPHIHFAIAGPGFDKLVTQMYVAGEPDNERDGVLRQIRDPAQRARVIVPLAPAPQVEANALAGNFEIVLGA